MDLLCPICQNYTIAVDLEPLAPNVRCTNSVCHFVEMDLRDFIRNNYPLTPWIRMSGAFSGPRVDADTTSMRSEAWRRITRQPAATPQKETLYRGETD